MSIIRQENQNSKTREQAWVVRCDGCTAPAVGVGQEPGDAADQARKEGFVTKIRSDLDPAKWYCRGCQSKVVAQSFAQKRV